MLDYLIDDSVTTEMRADLQEHLRGCEHCEVTLNTTRKTIQVFCNSEPIPLPDDVRKRLHTALIERLRGNSKTT